MFLRFCKNFWKLIVFDSIEKKRNYLLGARIFSRDLTIVKCRKRYSKIKKVRSKKQSKFISIKVCFWKSPNRNWYDSWYSISSYVSLPIQFFLRNQNFLVNHWSKTEIGVPRSLKTCIESEIKKNLLTDYSLKYIIWRRFFETFQ